MDVTKLKELGACSPGVEWAAQQRNPQQAWDDCQRGDWMLWLLAKRIKRRESASHRKLVLCACVIARTALKYVAMGDGRPRKAIETAEGWARREGPTVDDVHAAAAAAYSPAVYSAAYAAYSAAAAAYSASSSAAVYSDAAAYAASSAAAAAADAVTCAAPSAASAAREKSLARSADIVRQHYPKAPRL